MNEILNPCSISPVCASFVMLKVLGGDQLQLLSSDEYKRPCSVIHGNVRAARARLVSRFHAGGTMLFGAPLLGSIVALVTLGWLSAALPAKAQIIDAQPSYTASTLSLPNTPVQTLWDAKGQLRLSYLLDTALRTHPSMQSARLDVEASGEELRGVQRQWWPVVSAVLENTSSNPTISATKLLRLQQTLWDGGRLRARVTEGETLTLTSQSRLLIAGIGLQLQIVDAWQNLLAAEGRIRVAQATIETLEGYKQQIQRRVDAEISPEIDLELAISRVMQTKVELTQAESSRRLALSRLEQYAGVEMTVPSKSAITRLPQLSDTQLQTQWISEVDLVEAADRHPNVEKARQDVLAAQQRIKIKSADLFPQVYLRLDQPMYAQNKQPVAFLGLSYTPGAGLSTGIEVQALSTRAASAQQAVDAAKREILQVLQADRNEFHASRSRVEVLELAVRSSQVVQASYSRQFVAGRKQWLDLMNSARELTQNQYALVDNQTLMLGALRRIQVRLNSSVD